MENINYGCGEWASSDEFFDEAIIEELPDDTIRNGRILGEKLDRALFDKVKTDMVMRIYGVSPEKARQIIASAAMPAGGEN